MSWPLFNSLEERYFYNQGIMLDNYDREATECEPFPLDEHWEFVITDCQKVDQIAQNNFQSSEIAENKTIPAEIVSISKENLKLSRYINYPLSNTQNHLKETKEPLTSREKKRKLTNSTETAASKRRKIAKPEDKNFESPSWMFREPADLQIEKRRMAYLHPLPQVDFSQPSKVDLQLGKIIEEYYGKIIRKNNAPYKKLYSKKFIISKLNTIDDKIKQLALTFFTYNHNKFGTHLTRLFDILCHKALIDQDKHTLSLFMNKYLQIDVNSPTLAKDRINAMDRFMKALKRCEKELKAIDAEFANKNRIPITTPPLIAFKSEITRL